MPLFDIIKHCQNEREKCEIAYKQQQTGGNDPSLTRKTRFAQVVQGRKYRRVTRYSEAKGPGFAVNPSYLEPEGQVRINILPDGQISTNPTVF